jgi:antitoxin component YwqK of YwqJK toxin-antitoxin module
LETNYANGKRHGNYKAYGPLGALNVDLNFYTGSINGINKYYDVVGNLIQITNYAFGDATGTDTRFYQNKEKFREFTQFDENKEGEAKYYNLQGQMVLILGYQDDILTYYMTMDKDGKCSGKTAVATETANIISKYPNGKTAIEINIEKGNIDGKFGVYSVDGNPQITAIYHHGVLNGPRFEYYSNGQVYKKENFEQESYEGLQEFYKEDGKLWLTAAYKNDELHGLCKVYTNGIVSQTLRYDSDILVEVSK